MLQQHSIFMIFRKRTRKYFLTVLLLSTFKHSEKFDLEYNFYQKTNFGCRNKYTASR